MGFIEGREFIESHQQIAESAGAIDKLRNLIMRRRSLSGEARALVLSKSAEEYSIQSRRLGWR